MSTEHVDVLIVGAGLSGIGAAYHLQRDCPNKRYAILEGRDAIGGTWDLFRYPGIRSDSDMYTLGYSFRPWQEAKAIADGPSILRYIRETAREHGIDRHIRYQHRVRRASWSSQDATWTVEAEQGPAKQRVQLSCNVLLMCSGYYSYEAGYSPDFPDSDRFQGRIIHPQKWPEQLDYSGQRVVVIGSGATAMTLVPAMAKTAAHVTMLQRSPTYVMSLPDRDRIADTLRQFLPSKVAYGLTRWKNVSLAMSFYELSQRQPDLVKKLLRLHLRAQLGPDFDIDKHFSPHYQPWDQRVCLVPNSDLFKALRQGKASVVTDHVERFTETGIALKSGQTLAADLIVTATGLNLLPLGGLELVVDGEPVDTGKRLSYKAMMLNDVPNLFSVIGYTNASWTLKSDLTSAYVCRLLNYMDARGYRFCAPHNHDPAITEEPLLGLNSGYVLRSADKFPKQGSKTPWRVYQNYLLDMLHMRYAAVQDGAMVFSRPPRSSALASVAN